MKDELKNQGSRAFFHPLCLRVRAFGLSLLAGCFLQSAGFAQALDPVAGRTDSHGDALPAKSLARIGTIRWRHAQALTFMAFLPGDTELLTAGADQIVHVWDVGSGKELRQFNKPPRNGDEGPGPRVGRSRLGRRGIPFRGSLSADGKRLATLGYDGRMHLWNVATGEEVAGFNGSLLGNVAGQGDLAISPDGLMIAVRGPDDWVHLCSADTGKSIRDFHKPENQPVNQGFWRQSGSMSFSPDGKTLAKGSLRIINGNIDVVYQIWDVATGKKVSETTEENGSYVGLWVVFAPDGKLLARTGSEGFVYLVDARSGEKLRRVGEQGDMPRFAFSPDGRMLGVESAQERSVRLWDATTGKLVNTLLEPFSPAFARDPVERGTGLAFSHDGKWLAASHDHSVRILDARTGRHLQSVFGHEAPIRGLHFAPNGQWLTTSADDGTMFVWDSATGKEREQIPIGGGMSPGLVLGSPDGHTLAIGSTDNKIELRELESGRNSRWIVGEKAGFLQLAYSPDSSWLAAQEQGTGAVTLFNAAIGKVLRRMDPPVNDANTNPDFSRNVRISGGLVVSPDGSRLAAAVDGSALGIWNASTGKLLGTIRSPANTFIRGVAFTRDNRSLATGASDGNVTLWEVATAQPRRFYGKKPVPVEEPPTPIAGRQARGGLRLRGGIIFTEATTSLAFSPDGRFLCQGRPDRTIAVWDVIAGKEHGRLAGHLGDVLALAFSPDGKRLASGSADTTALVWDVSDWVADLPAATLAAADVEARWTELASNDSAKAFDAICVLASSPKEVLPYLQKNLQPADPTPSAQIEHWIADLDNDQYKLREHADQELEKVGDIAEEPLRKALQDKPSLEAQERIEQLLSKLSRQTSPSAACLRELRAVEVLEKMAIPQSRELLQALASGGAGALRTRVAQEALRRLTTERR
jgi:WD40 repeat protein